MNNISDKILEIDGNSEKDCRNKLYMLYGTDYHIVDVQTDFKPAGLFKLRTKPFTVVRYTVNHHNVYNQSSTNNYSERTYTSKSEDKEFIKNRDAIVNNNTNIVLTNTISKLTQQMEEMKKNLNTKLDSLPSTLQGTHENIKKIQEIMQDNEFTYSYIEMIVEKIKTTFSLDQLEDFALIQRYVVDWIGETISIAKEKIFRPPHVIIIVGPTGVGKTTTIAKLASNTIIDAKKANKIRPELCILTIDTMRVGALEQLSKFGDILNKEVQKAESSEDVLEIYEKYKNHIDYMFIDTSGYSPNDSSHIAEMKNILSVDNLNPDVYLSVSATTKASDLSNIFRNYEPFAYESVIVTKCDETKQIGNVISVLFDKHKSVSYITDGQRVPRNIKKATVVDFLKCLNGFDIDRVHIEDKFGEK